MNGIQKVIKYCAMAFALFLAVSIFGAIVAGVTGLAVGVTGIKQITDNTERTDLSQQYTETEISDLGIHTVYVDCNADITVRRGTILSIEATDVATDYEIKCTNGKFSIVQDRTGISIDWDWLFDLGNVTVQETVVVTVPESFDARQIVVNSGSGKVIVEDIEAKELKIDSGSGAVVAERLEAELLLIDSGSGRVTVNDVIAGETRMDTGSGGVTIENGLLGRLNLNSGSGTILMNAIEAKDVVLDSGSGSVTIKGVLSGNCDFETGSGSLSIALDGAKEEYLVKAKCGSGTFRINGKKVDDGSYGTDVKGALVINSGSGSVNVDFNTPEAE